jgi:hypothetical protein
MQHIYETLIHKLPPSHPPPAYLSHTSQQKPLTMAPQRPEFLTQLQWDTLVAIADGIIPKLTDEEATKILVEHKRAALNPATDGEILAFLQCLPSENPTFLTLIADVFGRRLPERALGELRLLLNIWT